YAFYRDFGLRFDECGYLFLADEAETLARLEAGLAVQRELGIPSRLLTPAEAANVVPGLEPGGVLGAAWCADDGYFNRPQAVVEAFAEKVGARGGRIELTGVRGIARDGAGWRLDLSSGGCVATDAVVVAAGAESRALLAPLGFELPIVEESRTLFLSEPIRERLLEPLVIAIDRGIAAKQLAGGRVLASDLRGEGDPVTEQDRWRRRIHE